jgi:signal transduction histidine kinase
MGGTPDRSDPARERPRTWRAGLSVHRSLAGALTGVVLLSLLTAVVVRLRGVLELPSQMLLYLLAVVVVALVGGVIPALAAAVAAAVLLDRYFVPPFYDFDVENSINIIDLVAFVLVAGVAGSVVSLAARSREAEVRAAASALDREESRRLADEQAALRRVAIAISRGVSPAEIFPIVAREVGTLVGADATNIVRLDPDGALTVLARVGDGPDAIPIGSRWTLDPPLPLAVALRTGRPARLDDYSQAPGPYGERLRQLGIRAGVAAPITVEGRFWGAIAVGSRDGIFEAETEERMIGFTELVGTAIANAESRTQLEESRDELRRLAEEQTALRRVATLVAQGAPPAEVFPAVAREVGELLRADAACIFRLDPDGAVAVVAHTDARSSGYPVGSRWKPEPPQALAAVLRTGRPARWDGHGEPSDAFGEAVRRMGIRSSVVAPIVVEGRVWGAMGAGRQDGRFPGDTEERIADFTELIGTAIANADGRAQLRASRARMVTAADEARRRIGRDLHDGTQQRLVALGLELRLAESTVPTQLPELRTSIGRLAEELTAANDELRELARGIHPAMLSEHGLGPALHALARRAAIPVKVDLRTRRAADPIAVAAYYVVSEALTNTMKHANASHAQVAVEEHDGQLRLCIRDDGVGGADSSHGSGLIGLHDRVQALGGSIEVHSPPGGGTAVLATFPLESDLPIPLGVATSPGSRRVGPFSSC